MIPFVVVVRDVLRHGPPEMPLPDGNHPAVPTRNAVHAVAVEVVRALQ